MKKIKSINEQLSFPKKYAYNKTVNEEVIEDSDANLNNKAKIIQQVPNTKKNL